MKRITLFIVAGLLALLPSFGQVQDTLVAGVGANYQSNLTKVDWNWARIWVEDNSTTGKVNHGICVFPTANVISQDITTATFSFFFEKIATGTLPATVDIYYKTPYTGYKAGDVNYPEGCTVLGSIELTTVAMDYSLSNAELKAYVKGQMDAGEDAVLFMRAATPEVKLSIYGNLGYPTLALDVPTALSYAPTVSISKPASSNKDICISPNDTITLDFSKAMDKTSVEAKFVAVPAVTSFNFTWQGDTIAYVICEGITSMSEVEFIVGAGTLAADATSTKADKSNMFYFGTTGILKTASNFWIKEDGEIGTNALSIAYASLTDEAGTLIDYERKAVMYLDLTATTSTTDFAGIMIKQYGQKDKIGWLDIPVGANVDFKLYELAGATFGEPFLQAAYDGMTKTLIDDIQMDSTFTTYLFDSQAILDYLKSKAGQQVCIALIDETLSDYQATTWISDTDNNPDHGAPVVLYSESEAASLSSAVSSSLSLYPQPVNNGVLNFSGASVSYLEVYSLLGARLMQQNVVANQVNVSKLNAGVYLIKMDTNEGQVVKQFVIE